MKRCQVLIPFHIKATDTFHVPGDVIEVSDELLAKIQELGKNMVSVLEDVKPKTKKTKKQ